MSRQRAFIILSVLLATGACQPVPIVTPHPVPSTEKLHPADCKSGAQLYQARLAGKADAPQRIAEFQTLCQGHLAGIVRRMILRCWHDATDAPALLACNDRF